MAFTGPVPKATMDQMLSDLIDFAVAEAGFTNEGKVSAIGGNIITDFYRISKNGIYWWFLGSTFTVSPFPSTVATIQCRMMLTLPTLANRSTLSLGQDTTCEMNTWTVTNGPFIASNMFTDGTSVFMVVETLSGVFTHLAFGEVTKFGTWSGGQYLTAQSHRSYSTTVGWSLVSSASYVFDAESSDTVRAGAVYFPINSNGNNTDFVMECANFTSFTERSCKFASIGDDDLDDIASGYRQLEGLSGILLWATPNSVNNRAPIIPVYLTIREPATNNVIVAGHVPNVGVIRVDNIQPREIVDVEWQVYPHVRKAGADFVAPITGRTGMAYKRIA